MSGSALFLLRFIGVGVVSLLFLCTPRTAHANFNITVRGQNLPYPFAGKDYGDVWGEGNIACMGIWNGYNPGSPSVNNPRYGVGIYDISNPTTPTLLSVYTSPHLSSHNQFEHGMVRNKIGYFGSWSGGGLHIVSLTNPAAPVFLSRITATTTGTGFVTNGLNDVHTMFLERNFVYEAAHRDNNLMVKVFDISNPHLPVYVQTIVTTNTLKVHQITVANKGTNVILYTSGWGNSGGSLPGQTDIWDVTHVATQPAQWLGRVYSGFSSHSSWPTPDGNSLVVCRETSGGEVTIYDITNPQNPTVQFVITPASIGLPASIPHNPVVVSNLLFLSWYQNGIQVFDISDRTKPVRVGSYDTYLNAGTASFQGNWGVYPFLGLNKLLLSDIESGFFIMDASGVLTGTNNYAPLLINSPTNRTINQGGSTTFNCLFTGSNLSYQWRLNGTNVSGATGSSYTLVNAQPEHSGAYSVVAFNASGTVTSAGGTLSLLLNNAPPQITAEPQSVSVYPEQSTTFSVAAIGGAPLLYQWRFRDQDLPNATNSSYTIPSVNLNHTGEYAVIVRNDYGSVISQSATLSLVDSPYISGVIARPGLRSALVAWNTTIPTDGKVDFGPFTEGSITGSSPRDPILSTNHTLLLSGLQPNTQYNFQAVSRAGGTNYISAVYQFTTLGGPIVVDNTDAGAAFSQTPVWTLSTNANDYFGANYMFASSTNGAANSIATFTPYLPSAGNYDVSIWYAAGANRATNAPFKITYQGGNTTVLVNQRLNSGQWNTIGSGLPFNEGTTGSVQLGNNAGANVVIADAVRFTYSANQSPLMDAPFPGWWSQFYSPTANNPTADNDGDGFSNAAEYVMGTHPNSADRKLSVRFFRSGNSVNIIVHPIHAGRSYTLQQRNSLTSGNWQTVAVDSYLAGSDGEGLFNLPLDPGSQGFYRVSVQLISTPPTMARPSITERRMFAGTLDEPACGNARIYAQ